MPNILVSPDMALPIPVVGVDPGPDYATNINNCLTLIDAHDHSPGYGVPVTPSGLNIDSDLPLNINNLTTARSIRFSAQLAPLSLPADLGCLYESGVDLYYNDGLGNQVRITQNGGVAGSPGSIANLTSPASASYVAVSETFVFQSDANTPANIDGASYVLRNLVANSNSLTLAPPAAMASDTTITLPTLPGATNILTMTTSGTMAAVLNVDNSTTAISANQIIVKDKGVTQIKLADRTVSATAPAGGVASSPSSGTATSTSGSPTPIPNLSVTLVTTGRPVMVMLTGFDGNANAEIGFNGAGSSIVSLVANGTNIASYLLESSASFGVPPSAISALDTPTAGTQTYTATYTAASVTAFAVNTKLIAYEI